MRCTPARSTSLPTCARCSTRSTASCSWPPPGRTPRRWSSCGQWRGRRARCRRASKALWRAWIRWKQCLHQLSSSKTGIRRALECWLWGQHRGHFQQHKRRRSSGCGSLAAEGAYRGPDCSSFWQRQVFAKQSGQEQLQWHGSCRGGGGSCSCGGGGSCSGGSSTSSGIISVPGPVGKPGFLFWERKHVDMGMSTAYAWWWQQTSPHAADSSGSEHAAPQPSPAQPIHLVLCAWRPARHSATHKSCNIQTYCAGRS